MIPQLEPVAVIGAGVSGLTAAYLLQRRYDVTLFEADDRLGGHAHTHDVITPGGDQIAVDSGFIVCNDVTYPVLTRLLAEIGVDTVNTAMGMSIRCEGCGLVYAGGRGLAGLLASPRTLSRPRFARMLTEIARFHREARRYLATGGGEQPLKEFLAGGRYSAYFQAHYILPVVSAVWSAGPVTARDYPAQYLFRFLDNHGMLSGCVPRCTGEPSRGGLVATSNAWSRTWALSRHFPRSDRSIGMPTASRSEMTRTRATASTWW